MGEIGVGPHIGRVLAAKLEPERREGAGGGALDAAAAFDRAGEVDVVDLPRADQLFGVGMAQNEVLEQPVRQAGAFIASAKRSPTSRVWRACLRITALPAMRPGTMELTAVR